MWLKVKIGQKEIEHLETEIHSENDHLAQYVKTLLTDLKIEFTDGIVEVFFILFVFCFYFLDIKGYYLT